MPEQVKDAPPIPLDLLRIGDDVHYPDVCECDLWPGGDPDCKIQPPLESIGDWIRRLIERIASLEARLREAETKLLELHTLRPRSEYHEDYGTVLWHRVPICEPPVVDGYDLEDIDESYTHWSPIPINPEVARPEPVGDEPHAADVQLPLDS